MHPGIFREYDIRGIAGQEITPDDAFAIGRAYGTLLVQQDRKKVSVGQDCRKSSEAFSREFIRGILSAGVDVVSIGVCPTPVLYFSRSFQIVTNHL